MRSQNPSVSRALVILPLSVVGLVAVSVFFYLRLDAIVHTELYRFELEFSYEWAEKYWANSWLILYSLAGVALVNFVSAMYMLARYRARNVQRPWVAAILLVIGICAAAACVAFFNRLESIVHGDLYRFSLQFSEEWAIPYWVNARLFLGLIVLLVAVDCASLVYIVKIWSIKNIAREKVVAWLLLLAGGGILFLAWTYGSSISAFAGLGFVLWGLVMLYAGSKRYVEESMLTTLIFPSLANLDRLLEDLDCRGKAFFLPPEFLSDFEACRVYISVEKSGGPPKPEHIRGNENRMLLKEPSGVIVEPPGAELTMLLEKRLGTRFTRVDLQFLQRELPRAFVERLQLAKNMQIDVERSRIRVTIEDFSLMGMYEKISSLARVYSQIGSPVASAIGCALAKSSGELVSFENEVVSQRGRNLTIDYRIRSALEEK
jgi:hypothetical protein